MAIDYEKVGWDTSKYINPTNMNHMDDGINAACNGVDKLKESIGAGDISEIGDGTITGAIVQNASEIEKNKESIAEVNSNLSLKNTVEIISKTASADCTLTATERKVIQVTWDKPDNAVLVGLWINSNNSNATVALRNIGASAANIKVSNDTTSGINVTIQLVLNYIAVT